MANGDYGYFGKGDTGYAQYLSLIHILSNALVDIALRGHQMTVTNAHLLANDLSTGGLYPVSYTHLDVYKRQGMMDRFAASKETVRSTEHGCKQIGRAHV